MINGQGKMTLTRVEDGAAVGNGAGLVLTHRRRHTHILLAVPKVHSGGNVFQQKPPWASEKQQFACGATAAATERFDNIVLQRAFHLRLGEHELIWIR